LYKFHRAGKGYIPTEYEDIYLCELFEIPYCSGGLVDQPDWWVEKMQTWMQQKARAQMDKQKEDEARAKVR